MLDDFHTSFGWGHLKDHMQPCDQCDGTGNDDDELTCEECGGDGEFRWGSFYVSDRGLCETCEADDVPIADMSGDLEWTCLPCFIARHRNACGCELWAKAEGRVTEKEETKP